MTTAHRPTWHAAVGQENEGGWQSGGQISQQFSSRDLPAHKKLKFRQVGQGTANEVELRDLQAELEDKEAKAEDEKQQDKESAQVELKRLEESKKLLLLGDAEADARESQLKNVASKYDDADIGDSDASSESESDSDDEDEEAELMRELEKIKRERQEEKEKKEEEERRQAEEKAKAEVLEGNPLTQAQSSAKLKRRWNDDVVFKNQSRGEPELKKRFVNDTIRNDFHRRFLSKYIQ